MSTPKILNVRRVCHSRLFGIEEVDLQFSNGERRTFERLRGKALGAVMIVPMLDNETILLVREYAVGVERYELGLPKGLVEPGEDALSAANREMQEEVGYGAHSLVELKRMTTSPGYMGSSMYTVLARDLYEQKLPGDEPEPLEVVPWKLSKLHELLIRDDFSEARSVASLLLVRDYLGFSDFSRS